MKKILIFTSAAGGGHLAASGALKEYLDGSYEIQVVNMLGDVLQRYDIISIVTRRRFSYEQCYNIIVRHRAMWVINLLYPLGEIVFWLLQDLMRKTIERYIREQIPQWSFQLSFWSIVQLLTHAMQPTFRFSYQQQT